MRIVENQSRSIIIYAPSVESVFQTLIRRLESGLLSGNVEAYHELNRFGNRFRQLNRGISAVVLLLPTLNDVDDMLSIQTLFEDLPVVLILRDRDNETISKAHRLAPRYMTEMDGDFRDIVAVLAKITMADVRTAGQITPVPEVPAPKE